MSSFDAQPQQSPTSSFAPAPSDASVCRAGDDQAQPVDPDWRATGGALMDATGFDKVNAIYGNDDGSKEGAEAQKGDDKESESWLGSAMEMAERIASDVGVVADLTEHEGVGGAAGMIADPLSRINLLKKLGSGDIVGGLEDGAVGALETVAGAPVAGSLKGGLWLGDGINKGSGLQNRHGGHRTDSDEAADEGVATNKWMGANGADPVLAATAGAAVTVGKAVVNTAESAAIDFTGQGGMYQALDEQKQEIAAENHRVDFFEQNREQMKKSDPQLYEMANAQYGARADEHAETQANMATLQKNDPQTAEYIRLAAQGG